MAINDKEAYLRDVLPLKTHVLGDCVFIDRADGMFTASNDPTVSVPVYRFQLRLTSPVYHSLKKEVDNIFDVVGGRDLYHFTPPDDWNKLTYSQRDEIRFTDQYQKTGLVPIYNPQTDRYLVPRPIDNVLSSDKERLVYFKQTIPPKVNCYTEGEDLTGLECTAECKLRQLDNGSVYITAHSINIYSHN